MASVLAARRVAAAQQTGKVARIGMLSPFGRVPDPFTQPFLRRLHELGWVGGQNLNFELRYAEGDLARLSDLAAELVQLKVDVILAVGTPASLAAQHATGTIPIVALAADPVGTGLVASLARPGSNLTGLSADAGLEIGPKRLELLKAAAPNVSRVAILGDPSSPPETRGHMLLSNAAQGLGLSLVFVGVSSPGDFVDAFTSANRKHAHALVITENSLNTEYRNLIVDFTTKHQWPTVFGERTSVLAGGLMSYGTDFSDLLRRAATYLDKILKGAKPADLPVEQPTKFELVINLKAAKGLGLTIAPSLLLRADEVIQ
jgi:putative ABC transport system substrate-binding protein